MSGTGKGGCQWRSGLEFELFHCCITTSGRVNRGVAAALLPRVVELEIGRIFDVLADGISGTYYFIKFSIYAALHSC